MFEIPVRTEVGNWSQRAVLGLGLFLAAGCTGRPESGNAPSRPASSGETPREAPPAGTSRGNAEKSLRHLENAQESEWVLAEKVLDALREKDAKALEALRITEREYKDYLFPEFPAAQPGRTIPVDFHWQHLDIRSLRGIEEAIGTFGGQELELLDVIPTEGVEKYKTFKLLRKVELRVRGRDGQEGQIKVFGSVVVLDGQYKILGFPT